MNNRTIIDLSTLTIEEVLSCLDRAGYVIDRNEYAEALAGEDNTFVYAPTNSPRFLVVARDDNALNDQRPYMVCSIFLTLTPGGIVGDYGGMPEADNLTYEEACEKVESHLR